MKDRISEMIALMRENNEIIEPQNSIHEHPTSESVRFFLEQVECCRNELKSMKEHVDTLKRFHNENQRSLDEQSPILDIFAKQTSSPALERMKEVQINSLIRTLNEVTQDYYNCLVNHADKCKKLLYDMISVTNEDMADFEELVKKGKVAFFTNNLLLNELEEKVKFRDVEERHMDILKVEESILQLKNLTDDLRLIVATQGERIHDVELYVQFTGKKVAEAAQIVTKTLKIKSKMRKRKLIISLLCLSVIVIIAAIIWTV